MTMPKNRAFLLIEVMVTVVVISVSIILINHAFTSSIKSMSLSNSYRKAIMFLENKGFDLDMDYYTGNTARNYSAEQSEEDEFLLESELMPLEESDLEEGYEEDDLNIARLKLSLSWQARGAEREIDLLTYVPLAPGNIEE